MYWIHGRWLATPFDERCEASKTCLARSYSIARSCSRRHAFRTTSPQGWTPRLSLLNQHALPLPEVFWKPHLHLRNRLTRSYSPRPPRVLEFPNINLPTFWTLQRFTANETGTGLGFETPLSRHPLSRDSTLRFNRRYTHKHQMKYNSGIETVGSDISRSQRSNQVPFPSLKPGIPVFWCRKRRTTNTTVPLGQLCY
ncbi:hypothetical protein FOQG_06636 [Fusarium oxysporum f. sp. raphani 54005]|uniref:Uncharacterized protein n=2 Tax=Fusarium oxysporum TaxID=5507 RepID=X0CIM7_FUSOX|nr:hypothetical protein FOQG_06636 [Fusarium oxysporum f. sp. raphani 54005]EXL84693.1 hypothetical protein FOPG_03177 [Fusarium oxysporum f. sp. conglutinans race 2 54008]